MNRSNDWLETTSIDAVGFDFYEPDPEHKAWKKKDKKLRKIGISKKNRSPESRRNPNYPTIPEIALALLRQFCN